MTKTPAKLQTMALGDLFAEPDIAVTPIEASGSIPVTTSNSWLGRFTVDDFVDRLDRLLSREIGIIQIEGEISSFTAALSGHWYFSLKGKNNLIKCVMFRTHAAKISIKPTQGLQVEITAVAGLYKPRGELQLQVKSLKPAGIGALYASFIELRDKLMAEGLFSTERKKKLPSFPQNIGIITSSATAALQDVLKILREHAPHINVVLYHALVQGFQAPTSLQKALSQAITHNQVELLLIVRGGGSMEDLFCFNDESFIRDVANCPIPIISGVGHETDTTLIDYVVDVRAPTPTAAASMLPSTLSLIQELEHINTAIKEELHRNINMHGQRLDMVWRSLRSIRESLGAAKLTPLVGQLRYQWQATLKQANSQLSDYQSNLPRLLHRQFAEAKSCLHNLANLLKAYDPTYPQKKGFAMILREADGNNQVVQSVQDLRISDKIHVVFADGEVSANVLALRRQKKS